MIGVHEKEETKIHVGNREEMGHEEQQNRLLEDKFGKAQRYFHLKNIISSSTNLHNRRDAPLNPDSLTWV